MGALIVVLGGFMGFVFAFIAYMLGANIFWILGIYALSGHAMSALLLYRYAGEEEDLDHSMQTAVEHDMLALREHQENEALAAYRDAQKQPASLFNMLRSQARIAR